MPSDTNAFFALPIELHTQIFSLACSPSTCSSVLSYYTAFYTGLALSLVSKYVHAASAPVRHQAVVLCGWNELLAFERILSGRKCNSRVRYLSIICDELPRDTVSLLPKNATTPRSLELTLLNVIKNIMHAVSEDLYELEIGFQVIQHIKDPFAYLSLSGPLSFPNLETMSYACPPSNAYPWVTNGNISFVSMRTSAKHPIICPHLKDLTVVCASFESVANFHIHSAGEVDDGMQEVNAAVATDSIRSRAPGDGKATYKDDHRSDAGANQFPSLSTLTIFAPTPEQALTVLDVDSGGWDVGSAIDLTPSRQASATWPPRSLRTVVVRPKSHWNERWDSLRDIMKRQGGNSEVNILVIKPGEHGS
ncbi:hypothetical protein GYMLUDRAFT_52558 [Collybiopsis luxurians FD-317 M1]|nr:hypothetical protein GYMLUDRAFT_52558 [Collybiopsis luxurians FD-317 M1]